MNDGAERLAAALADRHRLDRELGAGGRGHRAFGEAIYTELQARAQTEQVSRMVLANAAHQLDRVDEAIASAIESVEYCDDAGPFWARTPFFSEAFHVHSLL